MTTVADQITSMMFDLGLLQEGEVPTSDAQNFAFEHLNDWIDDLKTQGLSTISITRTLWTLTSASSYTIGSGATINVDRPINPQTIQNIGYVDNGVSPANEILCGVPLSNDAYEAIVLKTFTSTYPTNFYYNPTYPSTGFGVIYQWPIPTSSSLQGVIYTPAQVAEFATVNDTVYLPPGYRRFFRTNGALELAAAFNVKQLPPTLVKAAAESMANVKRANYRLTDMELPQLGMFRGVRGKSNIYTDVDG